MKRNSEHQVDERFVMPLTFILIAAVLLTRCSVAPPAADNAAALHDIASHAGGAEIVVEGPVVRIFPPETGPSGVHERFIVLVSSGSSTAQLFVADNISVGSAAPLHVGNQVKVKGELDFNDLGPVLHWTHRDPRLRHQPGFVEVGGRVYE